MKVALALAFGLVASYSTAQKLTAFESQYQRKFGNVIDAILQDVPLAEFEKVIGDEIDSPIKPSGWTPLCFAVAHGREDIALWLLKKGANPNVDPGRGKTLINLAAQNLSSKVFRALARRGLDVNHADSEGVQPKHLAIFGVRYVEGSYSGFGLACLETGIEFSPEERWAMICRTAKYLPIVSSNYNWLPKSLRGWARRRDVEARRDGFDLIERLWVAGVSEKDPGLEKVAEKLGEYWPSGDHPVYRAARNGDLELLKLAIRFTPDWKSRFRRTGDLGWSLCDDAYWCKNMHIVRFLLNEGFPQPVYGKKARLELEGEYRGG